MWTDKTVKSIKPRDQRFRLSEQTKQRGTGRLVLDIKPNGVKTFFFKYSSKEGGSSKRIHIKIGRYRSADSGYTLSDARNKANKYTDMIKKGIDPKIYLEEQEKIKLLNLQKREAEKKQGTFEQLLDSYTNNMLVDGKRSVKSVKTSLKTYVKKPFPEMIYKKANNIEAEDIKEIISKIIRKGVTTHSNRVRSYLHAAFMHGLKQDNNPRSFIDAPVKFNLKYNPVAFVPKQDDYEYIGEHLVDESEIEMIWEKIDPEITSVLMKLSFITGQRTGELRRIPISDVDLNERVLLINKNISKNGRDHLVPLSDMAINVLVPWINSINGCDFLFPGLKSSRKYKDDKYLPDKCISASTICTHLRESLEMNKKVNKFIFKDIRRTVKTLMGKAGIDKSIRDRVQNHALNDVSTKHYDRYDYLREKKEALDIWSLYLYLVIHPNKKVTPIKRSA